jgi:hypothetical protein
MTMIAYCGPGRAPYAAIVLALHGEFPDRIEETGCLPDPADIYVVNADPAEFITGPVQLRDPPRPGLPDIIVNRPGDAIILGGLS